MKSSDTTLLTPNQRQAINELRKRLAGLFDNIEMTLFGSAARGETDDESDLDVLLVTKFPIQKRTIRHQITDIVCEINLQFNTNISTLVVDQTAWRTGLFSILPIHQEILKEGIRL